MPATTPGESRPENVRTYLQLNRLLDGIQKDYPEVSAPLRLILLRARRDGQMGYLDESRFRAMVAGVRLARPASAETEAPSKERHARIHQRDGIQRQ